MQNYKKCLYVLIWFVACVSFSLGLCQTSFSWQGQGYAPEHIIPMHANESYDALAKRVMPADARLIYDPVAIDFGADKQGLLLIMATQTPAKQYQIWYLAPQNRQSVYNKIFVRLPERGDKLFDWRVHSVFGIGPEGARDLVLLEEYIPTTPSGGESRRLGSVYRRSNLDAMLLKQASASLDNVRIQSEAKEKLKPWVTKIPSPEKNSLIAYFLEAPVEFIHETKLERWNLIKEGSNRLLVRDFRNGFVHIAGDGGAPGYILALFKTLDQSYLFALQHQFTVGQHTVFLKRVDNQWHDVSSNVLSEYNPEADYRIPRVGTDLIFFDPKNNKEHVLKWDRHRFVHQ